MAGFNKMIAMGNLTKDPVLRTIPSGAQVCDMTLATNRTFLVGGEKREETCFIDVAVWGKQGEACGKFLKKGRPVLIEGRLVLQQWEKDGEKREETCFIDVAVWGKQGEACGKFLKKGRPVLIEGRLVLQQWEKDGEKRSKHIITAERVQFLGAPKGAPAEVEAPAASEDEVPF